MEKITHKMLTLAFLLLTMNVSAQKHEGWIKPSTVPNKCQQQMIKRRYGMFIHFGINTFSGKEWSNGTLPPSLYNPSELNTDQWARTARDAGMQYVILITKHHDGFCLWDSKYTKYDVASSKVKTDVIASMAKSCKKYGLKLGFYYSLWDRNWNNGEMRGNWKKGDKKSSDKYLEYMLPQLKELLNGKYGDICELWLDGGWVAKREMWQVQRIYTLVKNLQPKCLVSSNWTIGKVGNPDFHTVRPADYKKGQPIRYFPSDFRLGDPTLPEFPDIKLFTGPDKKLYYLPFETTVCLNKHWFWQPYDKKINTLEYLIPLYERSTAQNNVLILNSPPDRRGVMPNHNVIRLREMAEALGAQPSQPIPEDLALTSKASADTVWLNESQYAGEAAIDGNPATRWAAEKEKATLTVKLANIAVVDRLRIREFSGNGVYRIKEFVIDAKSDGKWNEVYMGNKIEFNRLINISPIKCESLRIRVLKSEGPSSIWHFSIYAKEY